MRKHVFTLISLVILLTLVLGACAQPTPAPAPTEPPKAAEPTKAAPPTEGA